MSSFVLVVDVAGLGLRVVAVGVSVVVVVVVVGGGVVVVVVGVVVVGVVVEILCVEGDWERMTVDRAYKKSQIHSKLN